MDDPLWVGGAAWQGVFGERDEAGALELVDGACRAALGAGVADVLFGATSVGTVFGLVLGDGRRAVVKAHQPRDRPEFLDAVVGVQRAMHAAGFPCPEPLAPPRHLAGGSYATFEELVDEGLFESGREPAVRRALAELLAWHLELTRGIDPPDGLEGCWQIWSSEYLWPAEAQSPIFDLAATSAGAEWIDKLAGAARERLGNGARQVGHSDWGAKHVRFVDGRARVVYDWDSLTSSTEEQLIGTAAATFTVNPELDDGAYVAPSPDEARAFAEEYSAARPTPLTSAQHDSICATATYVLAYCARCEHSLGHRGPFTEALATHGLRYLSTA